ncbi:MAG: hypothetical protein EA401_06395 [Planctomycetota bacterium]|nr:MAG: hypothetical protein EA401_06395 [Planctomycetota bacterium]
MRRQWRPRTVLGCMSGTSCDGVDVVAVSWGGDGRPQLLAHAAYDWGDLADRVRAYADGAALSAGASRHLQRDLAQAHIEAIARLPAELQMQAELVAVHGQTVYHAPPLSWQMIDAAWIAARLSRPVVTDFRSADLAAGGQGAPITPLADQELFPGKGCRAVVNLGGFINITLLDNERVCSGRDLCLANQLLDRAARTWLQQPFDMDGACASTGQPQAQATAQLAQELMSQNQGRSLGTADQVTPWIQRWQPHLSAADALASICQAIATCLHDQLQHDRPHTVWLAGGGVANAALLQAIARTCTGMRVVSSDAAGVPPLQREAAAMAILARRLAMRQAITIPAVTGCTAPAPLGATWIYP